jgi:hypothetical protein
MIAILLGKLTKRHNIIQTKNLYCYIHFFYEKIEYNKINYLEI